MNIKKLAAFVLSFGLVVPHVAYAEGRNGKCGNRLSYSKIGNTVTFSGYGEMYCYNWLYRSPFWNRESEEKIAIAIIGEGVTLIGDSAFKGCDCLREVIIPSSVREIGYAAFKNCYDLRRIVIPEGVTTIRDYAFMNCTNLEEVVIPYSVREIGRQAFAGCKNLVPPRIDKKRVIVGDGAFG